MVMTPNTQTLVQRSVSVGSKAGLKQTDELTDATDCFASRLTRSVKWQVDFSDQAET